MDLIGADTETGGLYPSCHALLSIAAVCSWEALPFVVYVDPQSQPGRLVDAGAAQVNGYTPELWARRGALPLQTALVQFRDWLTVRRSERPQAKIVCHNLKFDSGFLEEAARVAWVELPMRYDWRCSLLTMAEMMDDGLLPRGSASLARLGELSGLWSAGGRPAVHDALEDARACLQGYQWLKRKKTEQRAAELPLFSTCQKERGAA